MIRKVFFFLATATLATSAYAQFGLYGTFTVKSLGGFPSTPVAAGGTLYQKHVDPLGGTLGAYYDFHSFGPVRLGADVRGSVNKGTRGAYTDATVAGTRIYSALGGVRASFRTPVRALKPYLQGSAGLGRSDYGFLLDPKTRKPVLVNNFEYHIFAGVDLKVFPVADFRVVELGYGGLDGLGSNSHNYPIRSISTGVVFHLPTLPLLE